MMLALQSGIRTARFWAHAHRTFSRQAARADRAALSRQLCAARADSEALIAALRRDGVVAVPDYWTAEKCALARNEIDQLIAQYRDAVQLYSAGADKRMFGVESVSAPLAEFHRDPLLRRLGEYFTGVDLYNFITLGARIDATPQNIGSGEGWHRDWHGFQFKAILYLSDVSEDNGPFEYLAGSHKSWRAVLDTVVGGLPSAPGTRYEPAMVDRLAARGGERKRHFIGGAGTLLLVDTSGIHRGRPLGRGTRYALTNYYYPPFQIGAGMIEKFSPLIPGTAERIARDFPAAT